MIVEQLHIVPAGSERDTYLPLLYLADDSVAQVHSYYQSGDLYALDDAAGSPVAIVLAIAEADDIVQLKSVAVAAPLHGQGIGTRLIAAVLDDLRRRGARQVIVGTSNSGIGPLAFYQKAGFRLWKIERDVFIPARGYPEGLEENGILLRDMVWMDQNL